jgi:hypothetical protein
MPFQLYNTKYKDIFMNTMEKLQKNGVFLNYDTIDKKYIEER